LGLADVIVKRYSEFHILGAATQKARAPKETFLLCRGTERHAGQSGPTPNQMTQLYV